jgi:primosomal protein N'
MSKQDIFADIVPQKPLGFGDGVLTFRIPAELQNDLQPGCICQISVRGKQQKGVVIRSHTLAPDFPCEPIERICTPPLLPSWQFALAKKIALQTMSPLGKSVQLFTPAWLWESDGLAPTTTFIELAQNNTNVRGKKMQAVIEYLEQHGTTAKETLRQATGASLATLKSLLQKKSIKLVEKAQFQPKQFSNTKQTNTKKLIIGNAKYYLEKLTLPDAPVLLLCPDQWQAEQIATKLQKQEKYRDITLYHAQMAVGKKQNIWWQVHERANDIVVGTRSTLFLPWQELPQIILIDEHDRAYKSEVSPKYWTQNIVSTLAQQQSVGFTMVSPTPRLETYLQAQSEHWHQENVLQPKDIEIIDLKQERAANNFSLLSGSLRKAITEALAQQQKVFLFHNKRGLFRVCKCRDCGEVVQNPLTGVALTVHQKDGKNYGLCHQTGKVFPLPERCPHCQSTQLDFFAGGTMQLEQLCRQLWSQAKIVRLDRDTVGKQTEQKLPDADIVLGTQLALRAHDNYAVLGIIDADMLLHWPDFRAEEHTLQLLESVIARMQTAQTKTYLQTYLPYHPAWHELLQSDYEHFAERQLQQRKELQLPPYQQSATITWRHADKAQVFALARQFAEFMKQKDQDVRISIAPAMPPKVAGKFVAQAFVLAKNIRSLLQGVNVQGGRVDIEPS